MKLLLSLSFLLSLFTISIGNDIEGLGETIQLVAPVDSSEEYESEIVVTESIDGSNPNVDLVEVKEEKKKENRDQMNNKRRPFGNKFYECLSEENRKAVSSIFKQKNVNHEEKKKQLDDYFETIGVKKSYEEQRNELCDQEEKSHMRLSNAVKTLPAAVTILNSIIEDKSLYPTKIGMKVGSLVKSLNKDTAKALFTLKKIFEQKPGVNISNHGKTKELVMPLENFGKIQIDEDEKESSGTKKHIMQLDPTTVADKKSVKS